MTAIDLEAWISIYFGFGFIRASLSSSGVDTTSHPGRKPLALLGYSLIAIGVLIMAQSFRHF